MTIRTAGWKGSAGNDTLFGRDGNDRLISGDGNDSVFGGIGNDTISSGAGNDFYDGGDGIDRVDFQTSTSAVLIDLTVGAGAFGHAQGDRLCVLNPSLAAALMIQSTVTGRPIPCRVLAAMTP